MSLNGYDGLNLPVAMLPYPTRGAGLGPGDDDGWAWSDDEEPRDDAADLDDRQTHRQREGEKR